METSTLSRNIKISSKASLWSGRIITTICILFLLVDSIMKIIRQAYYVQATVQMGFPNNSVLGIGVVLLICTILYVIPKTAIFGAVLLTGYLGGAVASTLRLGESFVFPILFGILIWLGLYLHNYRLRNILNYLFHGTR